jgi:hypothetical protein
MRWLVPILSVVACIPSPDELCRRGVELDCTRQFECQRPEVKASDGFKGGWGSSVEECKRKVAEQARCSEKVTQNELCIGEDQGKTFDLGKAATCSSERKAQSCGDFLDPAKLPAACNERCRLVFKPL